MDDLLKKRQNAIIMDSARENFLTKHCNIIYKGMGTENYVAVDDVIQCRAADEIDWSGKTVYLGVDLSETTDNTAVAMVALDDDGIKILAQVMCFIPADRIDEKSLSEKVDYQNFIEKGFVIPCGSRVIDYSVVEDYVFGIEQKFSCKIAGIGFDRYNAISSAQKWDKFYVTEEVKQHSSVLHPATKLLKEKILKQEFLYEENKLLEINFQNARCQYDTNKNMYVTKRQSKGKGDKSLETRANMTYGDNGAVIPKTIVNKIIDTVNNIAPIFSRSTKYYLKGDISIPYVNTASGDITVAFASEFSTLTASAVKISSIELKGFLAACLVVVSRKLVNNSQFDIVSFVIDRMAQKIAIATAGKDFLYYGDFSGLAVKIAEDPNIQVLNETYATQHGIGFVLWLEIDNTVENPQKIVKGSIVAAN